jgi:hypothetical protein
MASNGPLAMQLQRVCHDTLPFSSRTRTRLYGGADPSRGRGVRATWPSVAPRRSSYRLRFFGDDFFGNLVLTVTFYLESIYADSCW